MTIAGLNLRSRARLTLLAVPLLLVHEMSAQTQNSSDTSWVKIIQGVSPAIVVIETDGALGSGFFVQSNGTIITNNHVIKNATEITVRLSNGEAYRRAYVLSKDELRDIAILRIEASDVPILKLGNSNQSKVGEEVLLIGAPRGLEQTVSNGIISGIRVLDDGTRVIQTTAAASPGSSGGPLLDRSGNVVGILTFSLVTGQNLNFAIPVNYAKGMLDTLALAAAIKPVTVVDSTGPKPIRPAVQPSSPGARTPIRTNMPVLREAYAKCGSLKDVTLFFKPDTSDCCAAVIPCYETVGVLETLGPWLHVRTKDNKEGYVHSMFLDEVR